MQPNLNPRYRDFRDRDGRDNMPSQILAQTNGLGPAGGQDTASPTTNTSFMMPPPKKTIDVIGGSTGTSRRSLEIDETKAIQVSKVWWVFVDVGCLKRNLPLMKNNEMYVAVYLSEQSIQILSAWANCVTSYTFFCVLFLHHQAPLSLYKTRVRYDFENS